MFEWPPRAKEQTPEITGRPDEPWWTRQAITWMDEHLKPHMCVLEWGAGASTFWLAQRVAFVRTIEHDQKWIMLVTKMLDGPAAERVIIDHLRLGEEYSGSVSGEYDAVIVDGRFRVQCCRQAVKVLKPGGILLLDNAERPKYAAARALFSGWPVIETSNGIWHTNIWTKPSTRT